MGRDVVTAAQRVSLLFDLLRAGALYVMKSQQRNAWAKPYILWLHLLVKFCDRDV